MGVKTRQVKIGGAEGERWCERISEEKRLPELSHLGKLPENHMV